MDSKRSYVWNDGVNMSQLAAQLVSPHGRAVVHNCHSRRHPRGPHNTFQYNGETIPCVSSRLHRHHINHILRRQLQKYRINMDRKIPVIQWRKRLTVHCILRRWCTYYDNCCECTATKRSTLRNHRSAKDNQHLLTKAARLYMPHARPSIDTTTSTRNTKTDTMATLSKDGNVIHIHVVELFLFYERAVYWFGD